MNSSHKLHVTVRAHRQTEQCSYVKQDSHCTHNVTLRRVRLTIVAVEKQ
jgi:hypothetical protein